VSSRVKNDVVVGQTRWVCFASSVQSRAPTERCVVPDLITPGGRRSETQTVGFPLAVQPVPYQPADQFVETHSLGVGASAERMEQWGIEANLDRGHRHVPMVTAKPDRVGGETTGMGPDRAELGIDSPAGREGPVLCDAS
jgi:hypothetical protein